ncbi:hypothetical protein M758_UG277700 [Ceratodon purpureus]|nr:hypothetical protein M758_UG277700 [Ceratodon purpureus]
MSQRREIEIPEARNEERRRLHRAAQMRDFHRTWRNRTQTGDDVGNGVGAGPSEPHSDGENAVDLNGNEDHQEVNEAFQHAWGEESEPDKINANVQGEPETMDTPGDECEDAEGPRLTPRSKKCCAATSKGVSHLMRLLEVGFTNEEKKTVLLCYFTDDRIRAIDPE